MMTRREMNKWLKSNLKFHARVCEYRSYNSNQNGQVVLGAETGNDLHKIAEQVKSAFSAKTVWAYGHENYLTLNF